MPRGVSGRASDGSARRARAGLALELRAGVALDLRDQPHDALGARAVAACVDRVVEEQVPPGATWLRQCIQSARTPS